MQRPQLTLAGRVGDQDVRFELGEGQHVMGRAADCAVVLAEPSVSRRHAEIEFGGGRARVRDMGSHNGTHVNGALVVGWHDLAAGDQLTLGRAVFVVTGGNLESQALLTIVGDRHSTGVAITWQEATGRSEVSRGTARRTGKRAELFAVLAEAGSLLVTPGTPEELFEPILDLVDAALMPERALIALLDEHRGEPQVRAARVRGGGQAPNLMLSRSVINRVLGERVSFLIEDTQDEAVFLAQQSLISQGVRTALAAPLFDNEQVIGLLYADSADPQTRYTTDELKAFTLLANCVAVALTHARYHAVEAEKQRLDGELAAARGIMHTLLPEEAPNLAGWELVPHLVPCTEVGGDLYDVFTLQDGRLLVAVGDVSGKGLGAALLVSSLLPLLRGLAGPCDDVAALVGRLDQVLFPITDPVRYATLFVGVLDPATGHLKYVNAGHNPPYVVRADGSLETLATTGLPVALVGVGAWQARTLDLAPGDLLALFTDGITEAWDAAEEEYGEERLQAALRRTVGAPAASARDTLLDDLRAFVGSAAASDDVTLVLVRRQPPADGKEP